MEELDKVRRAVEQKMAAHGQRMMAVHRGHERLVVGNPFQPKGGQTKESANAAYDEAVDKRQRRLAQRRRLAELAKGIA